MKIGVASHPAMYYFVWDMFCGWSSHEIRYHVIGKGESGTYYELAPGPWTKFMPYGDLDRMHYDTLGNSLHRLALNSLKHTDHEPIHHIVMVEEVWPKKYNLSDHAWKMRFDEPKDPISYFWQRWEMDENGRVISVVSDYMAYLHQRSIAGNPRLGEEVRQGKEHYVIDPSIRLGSNN